MEKPKLVLVQSHEEASPDKLAAAQKHYGTHHSLESLTDVQLDFLMRPEILERLNNYGDCVRLNSIERTPPGSIPRLADITYYMNNSYRHDVGVHANSRLPIYQRGVKSFQEMPDTNIIYEFILHDDSKVQVEFDSVRDSP